jgi:hypothetical protein
MMLARRTSDASDTSPSAGQLGHGQRRPVRPSLSGVTAPGSQVRRSGASAAEAARLPPTIHAEKAPHSPFRRGRAERTQPCLASLALRRRKQALEG